ncbi:two component, sigma54 specific, Fis family transcriptional regulator [mine drainage metagenome]|uniref:Two component, sigma54 specific, Fis family transcriptional regulator n=1 Tax=mine drainage metagenome TaxID=410659 RepID=T0YT25_9ZZZZ
MTQATVLVVDDEADIRRLIRDILVEEGYDVFVAGTAAEARDLRSRHRFDLVLLDIWMPDTDGISLLTEWSKSAPLPTIMISGHGSIDAAMEASRYGAVDFLEKPISMAKLLQSVERALLSRTSATLKESPDVYLGTEPVGKSPLIHRLRQRLLQVAQTDSPVLFTGESGSGRERYARWLHQLRKRPGSFVSITNQLLDGNLTHLTDAIQQAHQGTLFWPELAELTATAQRTTRDLIQGDSQSADTRFLLSAAALPSIHSDVASGKISRPLFDALAVITLDVPPVRDYREDVPELLRQSVNLLVDTRHLPYRRFSVAAQNRLRNYSWPGNLRQVLNVVEQLLVTGSGDEITLEEAENLLLQENPDLSLDLLHQDWLALPLREARERFERGYFQAQLRLCEGRIGRLAEKVGMERTHLYRKLRHLGIDPTRTSEESD